MTNMDLQYSMELLTTDGILIYPAPIGGLHSLIVKANDEACRILDRSRKELLTMTLADAAGGEPLPLETVEQVRADGEGYFERTFRTPLGRDIPTAITVRSMPMGEKSMIVAIIRDMSEQHRLEKDLAEAKKRIKAAGEIKTRFLANMSHELRTPLNGIMGMTQIIMNSDIPAHQKEYLALSLDAARHLNKTVTNLLALSGIQSEIIDLSPVEFNLRETLAAITKPLSLQAAKKSLRLKTTIAHDVPAMVLGDAGKLRQVLINLLLNAIKFTEDGEILLSVERTGPPDGDMDDPAYIRFTVSDTGIGIPFELQETIFESFSQVEDYMTKQYGGAGLGLSISQQLARLMNGDISLKSIPGKGSKFSLAIPLPASATFAENDNSNDEIPSLKGSLKILLAEDEQVNSIMASRLLKNAGHTVTIAGNGQQALDLLSNNTYDLVLMDVQMPVLNGLQATEIIRSGAAENIPCDLPVIGLTAYARKEERQQFFQAGMQHIVTKPYEAEELMQAIAKSMAG